MFEDILNNKVQEGDIIAVSIPGYSTKSAQLCIYKILQCYDTGGQQIMKCQVLKGQDHRDIVKFRPNKWYYSKMVKLTDTIYDKQF